MSHGTRTVEFGNGRFVIWGAIREGNGQPVVTLERLLNQVHADVHTLVANLIREGHTSSGYACGQLDKRLDSIGYYVMVTFEGNLGSSVDDATTERVKSGLEELTGSTKLWLNAQWQWYQHYREWQLYFASLMLGLAAEYIEDTVRATYVSLVFKLTGGMARTIAEQHNDREDPFGRLDRFRRQTQVRDPQTLQQRFSPTGQGRFGTTRTMFRHKD